MGTMIEEIGETLKRTSNVAEVQYNQGELVVTLMIPNNRKQTVRLDYRPSTYGQYGLLRFQSRVCAPRSATQIRNALEMNGGSHCWGLALDTAVTPPVLDVVYNVVAQNTEVYEVLNLLLQVATRADELERTTTNADSF